ncbi:MAG TPA: tetratricopeptide repeat protein [Streptosporangiaceae bacterium]|jgi:putative thioredoxin
MQQPQGFSISGAVDLGARQAAAQRRQQATEVPVGGGQPGAVIEVTDETFNAEVALRSRSVPVIMDLWAEWCEPCKQLGPVLEKLAVEANGAWVLAKVDVDANPQLSAALQVQSIPMVVAVIGGQVADGFLGALPEQQVRGWIGQVLQAAAQMGLPGPDGDVAQQPGPQDDSDEFDGPQDPAFAAAQQALSRGDLDAAAAAFEKMLAGSPGDPAATMGLREVELHRRVAGYDQARVRQEAAAGPREVAAQTAMADLELVGGDVAASFRRLLDLIRVSAGEDKDRARVHLLGLFEIFPPRDPQVTKARAALSSLLF